MSAGIHKGGLEDIRVKIRGVSFYTYSALLLSTKLYSMGGRHHQKYKIIKRLRQNINGLVMVCEME